MAEYINRQALLRYLNDIWLTATPNDFMPDDDRHLAMVRCMGLNDAIDAVKSIPAADVRPVVRAHWYWDKDGMDWNIGAWCCSACKAMSPMWWNTDRGSPMHKSGHNFCPNCGADMREES